MPRLSSLAPRVVLAVLPLAGCTLVQAHMCSDGEYPTWRPDGPGATCFADGEEPTAGYVRYPAGDVPDLLDDDYQPLQRYPELKPWAREYVAWLDAGATGEPPPMPAVTG